MCPLYQDNGIFPDDVLTPETSNLVVRVYETS